MARYKIRHRIPKPGETRHLRQAYQDDSRWFAEKVIPAGNRNGHTVYECATCHETETTRRYFSESPKVTRNRIAAWRREHTH
jgi:cytochrome c553